MVTHFSHGLIWSITSYHLDMETLREIYEQLATVPTDRGGPTTVSQSRGILSKSIIKQLLQKMISSMAWTQIKSLWQKGRVFSFSFLMRECEDRSNVQV